MNKNDKNDIAGKLKAYRMNRLWTLQQMANMANLSFSAIQKIENGKCKPSELTLAKLKRAFPDLEYNPAA